VAFYLAKELMGSTGCMINKKIYLLEDDPDIRTIVKLILSRDGYEVRAFEKISDFNEELVKEQSPDLFIMDISLPDGNGLDLCKKLADDKKYLYVPVLIMSAGIVNEDKLRDSGARSFVNKPFEMKTFLKKVRDLLFLRQRRDTAE
jgi:two-component system phosphate regulon response regulator PhoB